MKIPFSPSVSKNPDSLLRLLGVTAIVAIATVIVLSSYGFYKAFSGFVITSAEVDSVQLSKALLEQQRETLLANDSSRGLIIRLLNADLPAFDRNLRRFMTPFDIIKVKVYDTERRIVYCSDPALIGKLDDANIRLRDALAGKADARLVVKEKARDLTEEQLLDVDVVETYVPIVSRENRVLGCFEVYVNVTRYRDQVRQKTMLMASLLTLIMAGVSGFSYLLVYRGAAQLKEAQRLLEISAVTDPLTAISNRGHLMQRGEEEFERVRRSAGLHRKSLGCIMLDLDHFKQINDTKGHFAGDQVLKEVANRLKNSVRPYDIIGRYGGEEFVVLLPDTPLEQALLVAERIWQTIREELFNLEAEQIQVTASLGVTCSGETDKCLTDILKRADDGMYKAKADGRDRVAWVYPPYDGELHS